ncbi:MAG: hypothetical protein VYB51_07625, partial [Gemmatimonadota bacterium]|nr:hypothetical protein [Gemmatimonadota bacterium]
MLTPAEQRKQDQREKASRAIAALTSHIGTAEPDVGDVIMYVDEVSGLPNFAVLSNPPQGMLAEKDERFMMDPITKEIEPAPLNFQVMTHKWVSENRPGLDFTQSKHDKALLKKMAQITGVTNGHAMLTASGYFDRKKKQMGLNTIPNSGSNTQSKVVAPPTPLSTQPGPKADVVSRLGTT